MQRIVKTHLPRIAVMGLAAVVVYLLVPSAPTWWDSYYSGMETQRAERIQGKHGAEKHAVGLEYFRMTRQYGNEGVNIDRALYDAQLEVNTRFNKGLGKSSLASEWEPIGPANTAGRVRAIAFRPGDYNTVYAGGASGGVFRSTNGGMSGSWEPVMDFAEAIPCAAIAIDPVTPDIVYAGTGEPTMDLSKAYGAPSYGGVGVMKSTDAGDTWRLLDWPDNSSAIHHIVIDPTNTDILFAASRNGLYKSDDAGESWSRSQSGIITDVELKPNNPSTVFIAIGVDGGASANGVYRSTTGGGRFSFSKMNNNWPASDSIGRIELAITPANPDLLLAFVLRSRDTQSGDTDFLALMKSTDDGETWERTVSNLPTDYTQGQGFYNLCAAISPTDADLMLTGGYEVYQSKNGGGTWERVTRGNSPVHVDQHVLEFTPDAKYLYLGNDGGVYRSATGGSSWTPLGENLETIQFYTCTYDPNDPERFYGGAQDHGIFQTFDFGEKAWRLRRGGDGGYVIVDPENSDIIYSRVAVEGGVSAPSRSINSGRTWEKLSNGLGSVEADRFNWLPPMILAPNDNSRLYTASQFVYTTRPANSGSPTWKTVGDNDLTKRQSQFSIISTMDICQDDADFMLIGCGDGRVQYSDNITALDPEWNDITDGLPNRWVSEVRLHPTNPDIMFAVMSGYATGHVWRSTDRGANWEDISGDLPDIPVNGIVLDPTKPESVYFIGTDIGLWYTQNGGENWYRYGTGLPNVVVYDLVIDDNDRLIAGTHGRGMWITDITLDASEVNTPVDFAVTQNYPNPFTATDGTTITFSLQQNSDISVRLYDATGRMLQTVAEGSYAPGSHRLRVATSQLRPGVYFYTITNGSEKLTRKMMVM
ncbi:T9SS type A sorting domain-containing protein [bacterium]|nr:T9SS type A sorting domain-containing protein [bacterium]